MKTAILAYFVVLYVVGIFVNIASIGKPRRPLTPGWASVALFLQLAGLAGILYLGLG